MVLGLEVTRLLDDKATAAVRNSWRVGQREFGLTTASSLIRHDVGAGAEVVICSSSEAV